MYFDGCKSSLLPPPPDKLDELHRSILMEQRQNVPYSEVSDIA